VDDGWCDVVYVVAWCAMCDGVWGGVVCAVYCEGGGCLSQMLPVLPCCAQPSLFWNLDGELSIGMDVGVCV
jgi:hypothetical protein